MTNRLLPLRLKEHRDLSKVRYSAVADHVIQTNHDIAWDEVEILSSDSIELNLMYKESLLISKYKPVLNTMSSSIKLHLF